MRKGKMVKSIKWWKEASYFYSFYTAFVATRLFLCRRMHDPERYKIYKGCAGKDAEEFLPSLVRGMTWKENERILDYGCGAGSTCKKFLVPTAELYNSRIDAVDISEEMITYAKEKNAHPLVQYHLGNIMEPISPFAGIKYDKIFSIYVLHYIKDYRMALKKFYDTLKPGGQLGFTVIATSCCLNILEEFGKSEKWGSYMKGYETFLPFWYETGLNTKEVLEIASLDIGFEISKIPENLLPELKEDYRRVTQEYIPRGKEGTNSKCAYTMVFALLTRPIDPKSQQGKIHTSNLNMLNNEQGRE